jgi:hypothetical protein
MVVWSLWCLLHAMLALPYIPCSCGKVHPPCPAPLLFPPPPQVALPELDGALEPIVFAGRDSNTGKSHSLPDRIESLAARAINWATLRKKKNVDKKLAITGLFKLEKSISQPSTKGLCTAVRSAVLVCPLLLLYAGTDLCCFAQRLRSSQLRNV